MALDKELNSTPSTSSDCRLLGLQRHVNWVEREIEGGPASRKRKNKLGVDLLNLF